MEVFLYFYTQIYLLIIVGTVCQLLCLMKWWGFFANSIKCQLMVNLLICSLIYISSLYVMMSMYSHITLSSMTTEYVPNDEHSCRPNVFI